MIRPAEIQKKANKEKVRDTQIEKDYILTWILTGVANNEVLSKALAFKGGTVLKKFYFKDYRYSEDLDFTLVDDRLSNDEIQNAFKEVFLYVREEANIPLSMEDFGIHETGNINFYISYVGPLGGTGANKRVKVDISRYNLYLMPLAYIDEKITVDSVVTEDNENYISFVKRLLESDQEDDRDFDIAISIDVEFKKGNSFDAIGVKYDSDGTAVALTEEQIHKKFP